MLDRYIHSVIRWHKIIVLTVIIAMAILAAGAQKLTINHDVHTFLNQDDPVLTAYDNFQQIYGSDDRFFIVIVPANDDVFAPKALALIHEIGLAARDIPYFSSVSSMMESPYFAMPLARAALEVSAQDDITVNQAPVMAFRAAVLGNPLLVKRLVAPDGRAAAVKISVSLPANSPEARREALSEARAIVQRLSNEHPLAEITLAGNIAVTEALSEAISKNIPEVTVTTLVLISLLLLLITRSIFATTATVLVMGLAVGATMGVVGWLGIELTVVAGFVPAAVATLAVADSIHLLVGYHAELRKGQAKRSALKNAMRTNAKAIFITSLTSVLGVLTLNFSEAPPYREMGNIIAFGIIVAYSMSMVLWPALMAWFPTPRKTPRLLDTTLMSSLGKWVVLRRKPLILIVGTLSMLVVSQAYRNSLTERWHEYLGAGYEARIAMDTVTRYFGGIHHVYYSLESGQVDGVFDADYLAEIAAFASWYRHQEGVNHVVSIVDAFRTAGFLGGGQNGEALSVQTPAAIIATLNASGLRLNRSDSAALLNADYSASIFEVIFKPTDSARLIKTDDMAHDWLARNAPKVNSSTGLGLDLVFAKINISNVRNMLLGATTAMLLISLLLMILLRSPRLGLISLIPNLIPIGLAYGVWGLTAGYINMAVIVVMGISLGLVVDDTVHFLCKYMAAKDDTTGNTTEAVTAAFGGVGTAILVSSLVLMVGFAGALVSDITPTRDTAILLITTIGFALLTDLFLLPPLLAVLDKRR